MTQSTNLKLDLLSATDLFDTDKIKSNFEKIDNTVLIPTKIIDNCVTDNSLLPLSAKQGKLLQDQITKLNGDLANKTKSGSATISTKQNDSTALQIRFDEPFPSRPYVTVSLNTDNANTNTKISVFGIDQTGFKVSIYDTAATTRRIEWIASV